MVVGLLLAASMAGQAAATQSLAQPALPLKGAAVVVLWASWCTSCRAELARLPQLAKAAAPLPVLTLAIDPPDLARSTLAARGIALSSAYADARRPREVLDAWGGKGAALPLAVAIDHAGRVCGRKQGLLGTDQLRLWAHRCR